MGFFKRLGLYWSYATRSLGRGGQRTLLAIFCVAVGVLAIVSLQLVGNMVNNGLTSNVREGNGGDISLRSDFSPFTSDQLSYFDTLKSEGKIDDYTAMVEQRSQASTRTATRSYSSSARLTLTSSRWPARRSSVIPPTARSPRN